MEKSGQGMSPADKLFELLETRLDNTIYRLGFAASRQMSRQMASHGHFTVNGKRVTIPSYHLSVGDKVSVRGASANKVLFASVDEKIKPSQVPSWLKLDLSKRTAEVQGAPKLVASESKLNFPAVIEFYSR
jgi:small subunit ribosomal protein S4